MGMVSVRCAVRAVYDDEKAADAGEKDTACFVCREPIDAKYYAKRGGEDWLQRLRDGEVDWVGKVEPCHVQALRAADAQQAEHKEPRMVPPLRNVPVSYASEDENHRSSDY
eukprot:CAMPEP_0174720656 /NCGR_PEP_ID=MMETSP1094-20130205/34137_1 /TAXON_ID=156173 /ORGANISM="Chrysochromulina brevifilum, Strain UTEX LB 985" /LENGTH=110 /DNA_ID=CAMNT_0015921173 /DNA_START=1481 /DNA_END=1813 /DNA_ORIENTATION=+